MAGTRRRPPGSSVLKTLALLFLAVTAVACAFADSDCWGEFVDPDDAGRQRDGVWWIKIRTADGVIGWTREVDKLSGADACG